MTAISTLLPFLHGRPRAQSPFTRLSVLLLSFGPAFVLLSLSYEALFYCVLCCALLSWMSIESALARRAKDAKEGSEADEGKIGLDSVRVSVFFLAFLHLGFFGVGNVASISSVRSHFTTPIGSGELMKSLVEQFYLEPVYRLMTVFAPFPMVRLPLFVLLSSPLTTICL